jgi:hypothetical protein
LLAFGNGSRYIRMMDAHDRFPYFETTMAMMMGMPMLMPSPAGRYLREE